MSFFSRLLGRERTSPEARFWDWFRDNSERLLAVRTAEEPVCDELMAQLQRVREGLWFELGPDEDGRREFIVSADGIRELFPAVRQLIDAAPDLPRWQVIAFRPRKGAGFGLEIGGLKFGAEDLWFRAEPDGDRVGLTLFIRGLAPENDEMLAKAAQIMLDMALGEYDVGTKLGSIALGPLPDDPASFGLEPYERLPARVDAVSGYRLSE